MRIHDKGYYDKLEHALNNHFPKGKSKERSQALMLFSTAVMAHSEIMDTVRYHMGQLLGIVPADDRKSKEYQDARTWFTDQQ